MKKRLLSILLMCCMVLTLLPTTAFAEGGTEEPLVCTCETACTAESMNASCTVCGADGALPENCGKYAAEKSGQTGAPDNAPVITAADVQALIDALPEAETISEDNAADVEAQLEAIDEAKVQLSDEDFAVLDFTRYDAAVAALMALSGEPDTAFAPQTANDHTHCYCGGSITAGDHASHSDVTYTAWDGTSSITYTNNTAYVYLTENATLSGHLTVDGKTLYLCLNGKTLASNGTAKIQVKNGGRLVLCDCQGGGTFKGATQSVWGGACIYLYTSTLDMFGGKLTGGKVTGKGGGGAIALDDQQCIFNMYGGEISGNNGKNYGGAIYRKFNANMPNTTGGAFNMYGGIIKNNTAKNGGAYFSTTGGTIKMTGGTISGNTATQSDNNAGGGAIYMRGSGTINISGSAEITGNSSSLDGGAILMGWGTINISDSAKINSNTASRWGGAICLRQDSNQSTTLYMRGGEISGNRATKEGGAVHVLDKDCQFFLYDGKITGNTSGDGGAIYLNQEPSWLIMQGGEISGNTATGNGGGVYIYRSGSVCQLYSGKIENNKASGNGGGIYINPSNSGQLKVGNKPIVQNNTVSGKANNVYLPSGKTLTIEIGMSTGASIGVTTANTSYPVAFSNAYRKDYGKCFFADDANAHVEYKDDQKLYLVSGAVARPLTVTFDPNGGTLAEADKTRSLTTGDTYGTLPVPNYEGYDFAGWYTEQNGGTKIERDTTVTVFGTQTLYAHWTEHEYTVTVVKIGMPEWGSVTPMSTKAKAGETVTLTATPTTGNQFLEWVFLNKPEGGGWVNPVLTFTMPAEDLTIQAKFTMKNYTISYTLEGVSGGSARYVRWGAKVFDYLPKNPTYQDWVFTGWKCGDVTVTEDMTYGDLAGSDTVSSIHIIAQWHQHEFNTWTNGYPGTLKTPADCTHDAVYYWRCVCGKIEYNDNHLYEEPGTALGHLWSWTSNGNGTHTRTCRRENCNATETDNCSGGTATCTAKAKCSTCNAEYGEKLPHDFTAETAEEQYLKSGSSCTEKAVYYKSCTVCGLSSKGTDGEATFESGSVLGHEWGAWTSNGNATHTRVCSRDASHTETENCHGGTADCTHKAACTVCGGEYGELLAHDFTAEIAEAKYLKSGSTCTEKDVYYKSCAACGLSSKGTADEATFFSGNVLDHDWGTWTQNSDEKTHTRICMRDTSHTETKNCHGGTATCTAKAVCTVCGGEYGEMAAHSFTTEKAETQYLKSAATCTEKAIYYKSCAVCGLSSKGTADEATFFSGNVLDHDWGTWTQNSDEKTHTRICMRDTSHTETKNCHGGTASCTMKAVCEVCKAEYGEKDPEHHAEGCELEWVVTETEHEQKYSLCGKVTIAKEKHTFGDWTIIQRPTSNRDGEKERICQICQYKETKTIPATGSNYSYYTIKAAAGTGGSITPSGNVSVREGRDKTFTITPDKGYAVANVKIDGKSIGAVKSYTFENVRRNHTIEVSFARANEFIDVPAGSYFYEAVMWAVENGVTTGVSASRFDPNGVCTRAQAVTFLWRAAGSPAPRSRTVPFTDVPVGSYYYDAVLWAVENGITKGTINTRFSPNDTCTRAQIVAFLWRSEKSPAAGSRNPFADVKSTAYYADAVLWAVENDITKGTTNTTFSPNADCTRAQIVTFLWRCKK